LDWEQPDARRSRRSRLFTDMAGYRDPDQWVEVIEWMVSRMVKLEAAFRPLIQRLDRDLVSGGSDFAEK
jgi:hypothetical protein